MGTSRSNSESLLAGRLYSCREAARVLDTSDDTVRRLIHTGRLDGLRIGKRCLRVRGESLLAMLTPTDDRKGGAA